MISDDEARAVRDSSSCAIRVTADADVDINLCDYVEASDESTDLQESLRRWPKSRRLLKTYYKPVPAVRMHVCMHC